jgi:predicted NUDIX family NTP pyrophosphohydrolase
MVQRSAGLLMFRRRGMVEVLLVHPGGPFWAKKDDGAWSIPKGLFEDGEDALAAAKREFEEETGQTPAGALIELGVFRQPSGKLIHAFAIEGEFDLAAFTSNSFSMEWPLRSGRTAEFPEADRAGWFAPKAALLKISKGQRPIVEMLLARLDASRGNR